MLVGVSVGLLALLVSAANVWWSARGPASTATPQQSEGTLQHLYVLAESSDEPLMRVRIGRAVERTTIGSPDHLDIGLVEDDAPLRIPAPATVTRSRTGWRIIDSAGGVHRFEASDTVRVASLKDDLLTLDDVQLPGVVQLHPRKGDARRFDIVEHVSVEQYLPGVIAKELYPNWHPETFRAQAIAARSYGLHERQRRIARGDHFDVESTTQDQAYGGATQNARAHEAVRATRGLVLTYRGSILRAYYSSTTGGRAASARDTWPTSEGFEFNLAAPIQASPRDDADNFSPLFRWKVERTHDLLVDRIRRYGRDAKNSLRTVSSISTILPREVNEFGRPRTYTLSDKRGKTWTISAESIRIACNFTDGGKLPKVTRDKRVNSGDFEARRNGRTMIFTGRGFGHGVGMSQFGAEGKAREGQTAGEILEHYYPGARVRRAY